MNTIWLALITGLTSGALSCFAVQGGLLAGVLADQPKEDKKKSLGMFLSAKVVSHFLMGGLLGLLGSALIITPKVQGVMQVFAGIFMILVALKLSDVHPIFRKFSFTPPKGFFRILRSQSKHEGLFTPAILGFLTILIPCGITQGMMILAVSSGNFLTGGLILSAFVLGTTPLFFALGIASEKILSIKPLKIIAVSIIAYLGLMSINTGQVLRGSVHTFENYKKAVLGTGSNVVLGKGANIGKSGKQEAVIEISDYGYDSTTQTLKLGVPVKLTLKTSNTKGCARAFTIPTYNISKILPQTGVETVEFIPTRLGQLVYTCSMGMYTGSFTVIQ